MPIFLAVRQDQIRRRENFTLIVFAIVIIVALIGAFGEFPEYLDFIP